MVTDGEDMKFKTYNKHDSRCYIFGIYVKERDIHEKLINKEEDV